MVPVKTKLFLLSYFLLGFGLILYGLNRYNGWDLDTYFAVADAAAQGKQIYGEKHLTLYPPPGGYCLELLRYFPRKAVHVVWFFISILLVLRIVWMGLQLFPAPQTSSTKLAFYFWLSVWAALQGVGAQIESGNINLLLMYFLMEGMTRLEGLKNRWGWGLVLLWLPVLFKPYLGLIAFGLTLSVWKKKGWKVFSIPAFVILTALFISLLTKGLSRVSFDFKNWLSGDVEHIHRAFTLSANAVNFGIPSYFYHIFGWPLSAVSGLTLFFSLLGLLYSLYEKNQLKLFCLLSMLTFCISPASFSYSMLLLWFPILYFTKETLWDEAPILQSWKKMAGVLFLFALIFLNPTFTGRAFFNDIIVPHRITTWFVVLGLLSLGRLDWDKREFDPPC